MVVRFVLLGKSIVIFKKIDKRYAKSSSGQVGVIPENYVQAVADPPEPKEPPPQISTFSNAYPNLDGFPSINGSRTSNPPPYDPHQYINPATYSNTSWQSQETSPWPSSPQINVRHKFLYICLFIYLLYKNSSSSFFFANIIASN